MVLKRLGMALLLIALTVLTSWYVARQVATTADDTNQIHGVPAPSVLEREVVSPTVQLVAPVVSANGIIMPNEKGDGWMLVAPAPSDALAYKLLDEPLGVKALINGGPSGFNCAWIGLGYSGGGVAMGAGDASISKVSIGLPTNATNVTLQCALPADIRASTGMGGMMVIQTQPPTEARTLPVTAVNGTAGSGTVVIVHNDGSTELRTVELGASDTYNIEIVSGLQDDESVLLFPVQQDFANAAS